MKFDDEMVPACLPIWERRYASEEERLHKMTTDHQFFAEFLMAGLIEKHRVKAFVADWKGRTDDWVDNWPEFKEYIRGKIEK